MIYNKFNFDDGSKHVNEPFYGGPECLVPTLIEPRLFRDERGYFFESFNMREFTEKMGKTINFVQDNESFSQKGTLRGMHYQKDGYAQAKLVRVIQGAEYGLCGSYGVSSLNLLSGFISNEPYTSSVDTW